MSVYFVESCGYVKVGYSANVMQRVATLAGLTEHTKRPKDLPSGSPVDLIGWFPGTQRDELLAHAALNDFWVVGEWYHDSPEVRAYLSAQSEALVVAEVSAQAMFAVLRKLTIAEAKKAYPMATAPDAIGIAAKKATA